jgi:hypothetical protein
MLRPRPFRRKSLLVTALALLSPLLALTFSGPVRAVGLDVMFLIDGSGSVGELGFGRQTTFVATVTDQVAAALPFGSQGLGAGVVVHSTVATVGVPLLFNRNSFRNDLFTLFPPESGSCPACSIPVARTELQARGRPTAPDVLVLLADGSSLQTDQLGPRAAGARAAGISIIAIALDGTRDLDGVASSAADFFEIASDSSSGFAAIDDLVAARILARIPPPAPVPEPGTWLLLAAGLALLARFARRRTRRAGHLPMPA